MALIEIQLPNSLAKALRLPQKSPRRQQLKVLKKLLKKARFTEFGQRHRFDEILLSKSPGKKFQEMVPTCDYSSIYAEWWHKTLKEPPMYAGRARSNIMHSPPAHQRPAVNTFPLPTICCVATGW
jgi:hypothetical protein